MSKKQVIELEWFSVYEKLPDDNYSSYPYSKNLLIKVIWRAGKLVINNGNYNFKDREFYINQQIPASLINTPVIEWCYCPNFANLPVLLRL
jgi:hypothetical protein